jgi:hypothetical protein
MATKTQTQTQSYNLNLSPKYASDWGAWEIAREILCNALDVDEHNMRITENGTDYLEITTTTIPDISQIFVIGEGTKQVGGETIGQFGEGIKMAALAATRLQSDSHNGMTIFTPDKTIRFSFEVGVGQTKSLHAHSTDSENPYEFRVVINIPEVVESIEGKILEDRKPGPIVKDDKEREGCRVFCKGVYITTLSNPGVYDWNLNGISINRDRNMVANDSVWREIANYFGSYGTEEQFKSLLKSNGCIEIDSIYYTLDSRCKSLLGAAFFKNYPNHILSSNYEEADQLAIDKGYEIFYTESYNLTYVLKNSCGVLDSTKISGTLYKFECVDDIEPYKEEIVKLLKLTSFFETAPFSIRIFKKRDDGVTHSSDNMVDKVIWLCESLFQDEDKSKLASYFVLNLADFVDYSEHTTKSGALVYALSAAIYKQL